MQRKVIQWTKISMVIKKTKVSLLSDLNGQVSSGEMLCVMGQSGAGKSSFLSIMSSRYSQNASNFQITGTIHLNGKPATSQQIFRITAFVRQEDLLLSTMTVEETLRFHVDLKQFQKTEQEKLALVQKLLKKLNLYQSRGTMVGGHFKKSISGGEKKRLAIGVELISDPQCLVLDEPTSGLDSHNAFNVLMLLKNLASQGKIVITAIHQPSSLMFGQFNNLMILNHGQTVYLGKASQIVNYMGSIGVPVNPKMNPCDFFMMEISEYKRSSGYQTPMTSQKFRQLTPQPSLEFQKQYDDYQLQGIDLGSINQMPPFSVQFKVLTLRSFRSFYRTPSNIIGKSIGMIVFPTLMGSLYRGLGDKYQGFDDLDSLKVFFANLTSFLFILAFFALTKNLYDTLLSFTNEKQITLKEVSSNLYSMICYFISRCLIQLPVGIILLLFTAPIVYLLAALAPQVYIFFNYIFILLLMSLIGYMLGLLIGVMFSSGAQAAQVVPIFIIPISLFGGLLVNLRQIPSYISWFQYLSPLRHCYSFLMQDQLSSNKFDKIGEIQIVRELAGINGTMKTDALWLVGLLFVLSTLAITILHIKVRKM